MWLVSVSVMLAVVQCGSSAGGSPRLPTRITPPFRGVSAARAAPPGTSRIATMTSTAFRTGTQRLMQVPPKEGSADECVDFAPGRKRLSTGASGTGKRERGTAPEGSYAPPARSSGLLWHGDGRAVAGGGDGERPGGARGICVGAPGGRPARRRVWHVGHEGACGLVQAVGGDRGQGGQRGGQRTHMRRVDADLRGKRPRVRLRRCDTRTRLHVGVQRNGDGGQDADDGHHDHELDEREAVLIAQRRPLRLRDLQHYDRSFVLVNEYTVRASRDARAVPPTALSVSGLSGAECLRNCRTGVG